ncbi:penicillin-binding transpeptidase domain-containing protein [Xylanimonas ulmi]|uniref:Cell division protein FtsI/penicillin-binding protein 2 n=1 Tax=Xylanimonas ulmi TaxID=228973 RepID=A0A4Q7M8M8_9MICO|nr:penicillin-binding transpeptidase domain-containing protein [Xylanibacterium ulmi]RZS62519.1 cell division protein FtsI/penicillin-binding protein 2 [Xylanibacterium ulmi]
MRTHPRTTSHRNTPHEIARRRASSSAPAAPSAGAARPRRLVALLLTAVLAMPLAACTGDGVPQPDDAAKALVAGLQSGSLDGVALTQDTSGDPQQQLTEILEPLLTAVGGEHPDVSLTQVTAPDGEDAARRATATLQWSWQFGAEADWTYLTRAELTYADAPEGSDGPGTWTTAWTPSLLVPDLQPGERLTVSTVQAKRADILDGTGEPLVTTRDVWRVGVDKTHAAQDQWESSARALAELVAQGGVAVDADAYAQRVLSAGPKAFVELVTLRQEGSGVDIEAARQIPGVGVLPGSAALAPTSTFARAILGRAGEATAEIIEQSGGRIKQGDTTGLSGLQRQYDAQLAGSPGVVVTAAKPDADASTAREVFTKEAVDGTPLQTTFDVGLQERAEQVLADVGPASAIVAIRPSTGDVLAAASGPGSNGLDTALLGKYAPGSTFKVIDALAFGRRGITPDSLVACTPTITVNGREFQNVPEYPASALGDIPLRTAIAQSCNTAMIAQHDVVSQDDLVAAATDLGLGVETPVGAPVFYGNVPSDATPAQHAATLIGQDRVEASPFTMARVAASVAAGKRVDPVLVKPATPAEAKDVPDSKLTADEAATLRDLMAGVVASGSATVLRDVPGIVGAKTGTAQFGDGTQQHTWMIAIAGDLAVAVFVEVGERGSTTSGPLMHAFLTTP